MTPNLTGALDIFTEASSYSKKENWTGEVQWHRESLFSTFTECDLLRETAWVVLCSGFSERIIRNSFDYLSLCFCDWESAEAITRADPICHISARSVFNNERKLFAIRDFAWLVFNEGFDEIRTAIERDPIAKFNEFPLIGPITAWHLAKNLGLDVAKPDRHLTRVANALGFGDAFELCEAVAMVTGEPKRVVDIVIWRYLANNPMLFQRV